MKLYVYRPASYYGSKEHVEDILNRRRAEVGAHHMSLMNVGNSATYAIVKNAFGGLVGMILGDGYTIKSSVNITRNYKLCLPKASYINEDSVTFPVLDFATGSAANPTSPLGLRVNFTNNQYCAFVNRTGFYVPVRRLTNFIGDPKDYTVPGVAPAAVTIITPTSTSASLSWTAPTGLSSLVPIVGYAVNYTETTGTTTSAFKVVTSATVRARLTVPAGATLSIRIAAMNRFGVGRYTAAQTVKMPAAGTTVTLPKVKTLLRFRRDISVMTAAQKTAFQTSLRNDVLNALKISASRVTGESLTATTYQASVPSMVSVQNTVKGASYAFTIEPAASGSTEADPTSALADLNAQLTNPSSVLRKSATAGASVDTTFSASATYTCSNGSSTTDLSKCVPTSTTATTTSGAAAAATLSGLMVAGVLLLL